MEEVHQVEEEAKRVMLNTMALALLMKKGTQWLKALKKYGMLILAEDSLGWQNRLIDKASVQFRLTAKNLGAHKGSFFMLLKMVN